MTTSVIVKARCGPTKVVVINVTNEPDRILQDGAEDEVYAYDNRVITICEALRPPSE